MENQQNQSSSTTKVEMIFAPGSALVIFIIKEDFYKPVDASFVSRLWKNHIAPHIIEESKVLPVIDEYANISYTMDLHEDLVKLIKASSKQMN